MELYIRVTKEGERGGDAVLGGEGREGRARLLVCSFAVHQKRPVMMKLRRGERGRKGEGDKKERGQTTDRFMGCFVDGWVVPTQEKEEVKKSTVFRCSAAPLFQFS